MQKDQQKLEQLIKGKKVAFIGAGVSHKTLIKEFVELGAHVTLCDQKKSVEDFGDYAATIRELGIDLSLGENYLDGFKGQDIIMRTPGFVGYFEKPLQDAMAAGTMVTSEVELFFDFCPCPIVAVTGSDGKTTTTTLIAKFFEAAGRKVHLGGNIGAALLPMLPEVSPDDVAVVELSSFQLISMHSSPNVAVVTNVTPNHLDHHKDMQEYIDAKRNILLYQTPPCRAVLGYENEISRSMQKDCKGKQVWFTRLHDTDNGAFLRKDGMLCMAEDGVVTPFLAQKDVKLRGLHNIENLLAAAAAVWGLVPVEAIQQVGSTFTGVEHRIEPVRTLDGVLYYNDSIGTSPTRTIAGLRSFNQKVILIAGGYDKHIPYEPLAPEVIAHVKNLVLMGATGPRIEKAVRECEGFDEAALPIQHADNMQHAVELARAAAKPGDIIILSPASASFDLYPNFEVRGRFLAFCGCGSVILDEGVCPPPTGWHRAETLAVFGLAPGKVLPLPAVEDALWSSLTLDAQPPAMTVAQALYPTDPARRDDAYSELCSKRSRGRAVVWALQQDGQTVCTVGAYAVANGQAYMACGQTAEPLRGKGIGGRLIVQMANALAAEGEHPVFLCAPERVHFYTRLGFAKLGEYVRFAAP